MLINIVIVIVGKAALADKSAPTGLSGFRWNLAALEILRGVYPERSEWAQDVSLHGFVILSVAKDLSRTPG